MNPIEKVKAIIAKGETAGVREWTYEEGADDVMDAGNMPVCTDVFPDDGAYIAAANPDALLPILRLLVECVEFIEWFEKCDCGDAWTSRGRHAPDCYAEDARALLAKLRSES